MDKIPFCFYFVMHEKFRENFKQPEADIKEVLQLMRAWNIPKIYRRVLLKEMEKLEMVKVISKYLIKINDIDSPLKDRSRLYHDVGLW